MSPRTATCPRGLLQRLVPSAAAFVRACEPGTCRCLRLSYHGSRCLSRQFDLLESALTASQARRVVVDPLLAFFDGTVSSANEQGVQRVLTPLAAMAARHGCAALLVRHLTKGVGKHAVYRGGGAIGLIGACRSA